MGTISTNAWIYLALSLFFLVVGVLDLPGVGPSPDPPTAAWELLFAVGNGLFYWLYRGAPPWVKPAAYVLFAVGVGIAVVDIFF